MQTINFEEIGGETSIHKANLQRLSKALFSSKRVIALTGAGISVSAGIPVKPINMRFILFLGFSIGWWTVRAR